MPPCNPRFLRVFGYKIPLKHCRNGERLFEDWYAELHSPGTGAGLQPVQSETVKISTHDVSADECQNKNHKLEDILGSCLTCTAERSVSPHCAVEFAAENGDNGYLLIYDPAAEVEHVPGSRDEDDRLQIESIYTRNGGYFCNLKTTISGGAPHPDVSSYAQNLVASGDICTIVPEPAWIVRYGYVPVRPIVTGCEKAGSAFGRPKTDQGLTTNEIRRLVRN